MWSTFITVHHTLTPATPPSLTLRSQAVILGEECTRAKPFPDPYLEGLDKLGLAGEAHHALVVEDSPAGIKVVQGGDSQSVTDFSCVYCVSLILLDMIVMVSDSTVLVDGGAPAGIKVGTGERARSQTPASCTPSIRTKSCACCLPPERRLLARHLSYIKFRYLACCPTRQAAVAVAMCVAVYM